MRVLLNNVAHWDIVCFTTIFRLNHTRLLPMVMPWISHSGDGYLYPAIAALLFLICPQHAPAFLTAALIAFAIELPLYKIIKRAVKRGRPCDTLRDVQKRIVPSDRFSNILRPPGNSIFSNFTGISNRLTHADLIW